MHGNSLGDRFPIALHLWYLTFALLCLKAPAIAIGEAESIHKINILQRFQPREKTESAAQRTQSTKTSRQRLRYTVQQRQCFTQGENVELLAQYGLFLAKIATVVVAIAVIAAIIVNLAQRKKQRGELRVTNLSEHYKEMKESLAVALLDGPQQKQWHKAQKKKQNKRRRRPKRGRSWVMPSRKASRAPGAGFQRQYGCP